MTLFLIEFLEKHNIPYIRREIKAYGESGNRISMPKDWSGTAIVIREKTDLSKIMQGLVADLDENIKSCERMRAIATPPLSCIKVTDDVFKKNKRNNPICERCPIGKRISEISEIIEKTFDTEQEEKITKISKQFYDKED